MAYTLGGSRSTMGRNYIAMLTGVFVCGTRERRSPSLSKLFDRAELTSTSIFYL